MADKLTPEQVRAFWTAQAIQHGQSPSASWSDVHVLDLEAREIQQRLEDGDRVLDVGCGNGYSTVRFAAARRIAIRGIDYIPQMIDEARVRASALDQRLTGTVEFAVGDVSDLKEPASGYDKVIAIRVLINLGSWPAQQAALRGCGRLVKPGGLLLLSEATLQGWNRLNAFRTEWGLPPIPMPAFNTYLDEEQVVATLAPAFEIVELVNFASTYYVGTRVLKPLLAAAAHPALDVADPQLHWNRFWAQLPAAGDYGTQKLFVFRKRADAPVT